jgi:hypothetical protein
MKKTICFTFFFLTLFHQPAPAQNKDILLQEVEKTMLKATRFMVEKVSMNGGYVWVVHSSDVHGENRWLVKHAMISHPYTGDGVKQELTDEYATTNVGDETDTSPFRDPTEQEYISTGNYIRNMDLLINYVQSCRKKTNNK